MEDTRDRQAGSMWELLIRLVAAHRREDYDHILHELRRTDRSFGYWNQHLYWGARACLDREVPDPERAISFLDEAEKAWETGIPVPTHIARLRAGLLTAAKQHPTSEELHAAADELDTLARVAASKIDALFLLAQAVVDADALSHALGDPAELRGAMRRARSVLAPAGHGLFPKATRPD